MSPTPSEKNRGSRSSMRPLKALMVFGVFILLYLASPYPRDPVLHSGVLLVLVVLFLLGIIAVAASQARPRVRVVSAAELEMKGINPEKFAGQLPAFQGPRKQIHDLSELPPELASRPEIRKLFEDGKAAGGTMWIRTSKSKIAPGAKDATNN